MTAGARWVRLGWWAAGAAILVACAVVRVWREGKSELSASETAWSAGNVVEATVHARRAALAFVPWASHVPRAYRTLREIAEQSEGKGDSEAALFAWRSMRAAAIGSRSWVTSHESERAAADSAIARLTAAIQAGSAPGRQAPSGETSRAYRAMLATDSAPSMGWGAMLVAGAALWAGSGVRLARRGFGPDGRLVLVEVPAVVALAVAGVVAWFAALLLR